MKTHTVVFPYADSEVEVNTEHDGMFSNEFSSDACCKDSAIAKHIPEHGDEIVSETLS